MASVVLSSSCNLLLSARVAVSDARPLTRRAARVAAPRSSGAVTITAGWFENNQDVEGRDVMFEKQQEILRARRSGKNVEKEVKARRKQVSGFMNGTLGEATLVSSSLLSPSTFLPAHTTRRVAIVSPLDEN